MYPVAFSFFGSETQDNWTWFMENLRKAIGDPPLLVVSSDACKGLENAVKAMFPHVEQRECFRHLMENYVKNYAGAEHMYPAARAYKKVVHEHHKAIVRCKPEVCYWLGMYHSLLWYKSSFNPAIKYNYVTNNMTESFNNGIKDIKDLPVCELADKLREKIMKLFYSRHMISRMFEGKILPSVLWVLKARTRWLGHISYVKGDNYIIEVRDNSDYHSKFVVQALHKECQCEEWQHTGLPCQHALCLIIAQPLRSLEMLIRG
jgi:zinc finger SWIM domain-containing protein 3